jgi:glycosyltransferase involved in cell wall biosynthesis
VRILHVITDFRLGGAETALAQLALATRARGHTVEVVALKQLGDAAQPLQDAGIPCLALHASDHPGWRTAWSVLSLAAHLKRSPPHVIHAWLSSGCAAVKLAAPPGIPRVMGLRVTDVPSAGMLALLRAPDGCATRYVAVSQGVADAWAPALKAGAQSISVIPNGVDVASQVQPEFPNARPLFLGRMAHQKGVDTLLASLVDASFSVDITGAGPDEALLRLLAEKLGISSRVAFTGPTRQARAALIRCSVLVLPSRSEGMPNAVLEAMAVGRAVVATDIPGTREVVVHGETGLLVPPENPLALRAAITRLQGDPALRARLGAAGYERARSVFGRQRVVNETLALYESLASPP